MFGNPTRLYLDYQEGRNNITLEVLGAYKNLGGTNIMLDLKDDKDGISRVENLQEDELYSPTELELSQDGGVLGRRQYEVSESTTYVKVFKAREGNEEEFTIVHLELDADKPVIPSNDAGGQFYRRGPVDAADEYQDSYIVINAIDNKAGIAKIELENGPEGSSIAIEGLPDQELRHILANGATKVRVIDAVGNETEIALNEIDVDSTEPTGTIEYRSSEKDYLITLYDAHSGLWKLVQNHDDILVDYSKQLEKGDVLYPREEMLIPLSSVLGIDSLEVYDAVGNVHSIELTNVMCIVVYAKTNEEGTRLAINVMDESGVAKVGVEGIVPGKTETIIEAFAPGTRVVRKYYELPAGITKLNVHSRSGSITEWNEIETYTEEPSVVLIQGNEYRVSSPMGIRKIIYSDNNELEFKKELPVQVRVNIEDYANVRVYDALDNMVTLTKE